MLSPGPTVKVPETANRPRPRPLRARLAYVIRVTPEANVSFPRYDRDMDRLATAAIERLMFVSLPGCCTAGAFRLSFGMGEEGLGAGLAQLLRAMKEV